MLFPRTETYGNGAKTLDPTGSRLPAETCNGLYCWLQVALARTESACYKNGQLRPPQSRSCGLRRRTQRGGLSLEQPWLLSERVAPVLARRGKLVGPAWLGRYRRRWRRYLDYLAELAGDPQWQPERFDDIRRGWPIRTEGWRWVMPREYSYLALD